GTGHHHVQD
ncbi:putative host specificity protein, partial [Escherichia coli NE1487]